MNSRVIGVLFGVVIAALNPHLAAQVPNPGSEGKIQLDWLKDYPSALKKAEAEKKPLLLDITTDWCGWSKKMDRESFADTAVQKELRSFVLIRLNPEASEQNEKVAEAFGVDGYPTLVVVNYRGEELGRESYMAPKELLEFLRRYQPLFKGNPLGYKPVQLEASDPLMKAIPRIPAPASRPTSVGSFVVLDQSEVRLEGSGPAKFVQRTATFVNDPEKGDLPHAILRYVSSRQKARFRSVRILDTKGKGREMDLKLAKDEHAYSNQNVYWDARTLSLELPLLKEGQILDVIEEHECEPIIPGEFFFRWNTGIQILLSSDLKITFPPSVNLQRRAVRCPTPIKETRNADGTTTWQLITSNSKPYEPALFPPPIYEIWEGYEFFTPCTQNAIAQWFSGLCRGRDALPAAARQRVASMKRKAANQAALLQDILDWVTKDVRYVSVAFGASSHQPHAVSETLTNLYGDCKDQSLLVKSLCREAGIPAALVLLDAFGESISVDNPVVERFNHCIVEAVADGKTYYLDPAAGPSRLGQVSPLYAGTKALKVDGSQGSIVTIPPYQPLAQNDASHTLIKLNPNGSGTVTETACLTGPRAAEMKEKLKSTQPEKVRKYIEDSYKRNGRKLIDFFMTDPSSPTNTYETRMVYTVPRFGSMTAGGLVFQLSTQNQDDWLAGLNTPRTQPFWFRATDPSRLSITVELPAGAVLKSRPEDLQLDTPFLKVTRKLLFQNNKLSVTESSQLLDARLSATEAGTVYSAFRKLQDHREYAFIAEMPTEAPPGIAPSAPPKGATRTAPAREVMAPQPAKDTGGPAAQKLKLNGISGNPPRALAIINGRTLAVGESAAIKVDTGTLTIHCREIAADSATVDIDGIDTPHVLYLR